MCGDKVCMYVIYIYMYAMVHLETDSDSLQNNYHYFKPEHIRTSLPQTLAHVKTLTLHPCSSSRTMGGGLRGTLCSSQNEM